jgi:hypothetical protein
MRILGIDPGISGACALYCPDEPVPNVDWMFELPTLGEGNKKELDYRALRDSIWSLKPTVAFIEQQVAFVPKKKNEETGEMEADVWGATSMARFMGSYYALRCLVSVLDIPLRQVNPATWKAAFNLRGKNSKGGTDDTARQLVLQRYPATAQYLKFKYHQHRAEAYLIAVYGARMWKREGENLDIPD